MLEIQTKQTKRRQAPHSTQARTVCAKGIWLLEALWILQCFWKFQMFQHVFGCVWIRKRGFLMFLQSVYSIAPASDQGISTMLPSPWDACNARCWLSSLGQQVWWDADVFHRDARVQAVYCDISVRCWSSLSQHKRGPSTWTPDVRMLLCAALRTLKQRLLFSHKAVFPTRLLYSVDTDQVFFP